MNLLPVPADQVFDGRDVPCSKCGVVLVDAYLFAGEHYCGACVEPLGVAAEAAAAAFARERCRITRRPLPRYDPARDDRCTPDEYALGDRYSHSPNGVRCAQRHEYTNYDELTRDLDRSDPRGEIYYVAIRERIEDLLEETRQAEDEEDDEGGPEVG